MASFTAIPVKYEFFIVYNNLHSEGRCGLNISFLICVSGLKNSLYKGFGKPQCLCAGNDMLEAWVQRLDLRMDVCVCRAIFLMIKITLINFIVFKRINIRLLLNLVI